MRCLNTIQFICVWHSIPLLPQFWGTGRHLTRPRYAPIGMKPTPKFVQFDENHPEKNPYLKHIRLRANNATIFQKKSCHFLTLQLGSLIHDDVIFVFFGKKINFQHNNLNGSTLKKTTNQPDLS